MPLGVLDSNWPVSRGVDFSKKNWLAVDFGFRVSGSGFGFRVSVLDTVEEQLVMLGIHLFQG